VIAREVLALVPGCENGEEPTVQTLSGGRGVNQILRIETRAGRFVLRQRLDLSHRPGSDPLQEKACHQMAAEAGLAPTLIASAADGNWLLMEFVDQSSWSWSELNTVAGVGCLGQRLRELHSLRPPLQCVSMDVRSIARAQCGLIANRNPARVAAANAMLGRIERLSQRLNDAGSLRVVNHGDLQCQNLLGPAPTLLDWEYAQITDPTYDIACLLTYYPSLDDLREPLLTAAGLAGDRDLRCLTLNLELFSCLNQLWGYANLS
jgi:thiamine kinase-like enzyme